MHKIIVTIPASRTEEPVVSVEGLKGSSCVQLTKPLEDALGGTHDRKLTNEYSQIAQPAQRRVLGEQNG